MKDFNIYIKKIEEDSDVASLSFDKIVFDGTILAFTIRTNVNHKVFFPIDDESTKKKYNIVDKKIKVEEPLELDEQHRKLTFYFGFNDEGKETVKFTDFTFEFEIPITCIKSINDNNGEKKRKLKFIGKLGKDYQNNLKSMDQIKTEEGVIIFEPD